jgi:hypothetical protein
MSGKFYVYEHWRPDRGECFYVGKGQGRRAYDMRRGRNRWHKFLQAKLSALGTAIEIKIIAEGLTEEEAFAKEKHNEATLKKISENTKAGLDRRKLLMVETEKLQGNQ